MKHKVNYSLYLVTDRELMTAKSIEECLEKAILGGCTVVQLREKTASSREFYQMAIKARKITNKFGIPLIINDRVDIALASGADGVHVGQKDLPCQVVRSILGPQKIVGVSVSNLKKALQAQKSGADYIGVGAMFATGTKKNADIVTMEELKKICDIVTIPVVAIGGINRRTISFFSKIKISGVAVVSAVVAQQDIESAARELNSQIYGFFKA
jgi:thiamine-phosphate pyrophosphorylase